MTSLGCVTGRFQPVHNQHVSLFELALRRCDQVVIAITNPDSGTRHQETASAHRHTPAANPFTFFERATLLQAALAGLGMSGRTTVVPFDLTRRAHWHEYVPLHARQFVRAYSEWEHQKAGWLRQAGYQVTVLHGAPSGRLSGTDIRQFMQQPDARWRAKVPQATVPVLERLLTVTPMRERR